MGRTKYAVGNWKMNKNIADSVLLASEIGASVQSKHPTLPDDIRVIVAPSFTALSAVEKALAPYNISLCAQNISCAEAGAHTGEISAKMLHEVGVRYAIVGHSERRYLYGEDEDLIFSRIAFAAKSDIIPIICVGELSREARDTAHFTFCRQQITRAIASLSEEAVRNSIIAYEPVWAIGTGKTARPQDAQEMHLFLRRTIADIWNDDVADNMSILYGGSVDADNSGDLCAQEDIDGVLVGGASLKSNAFISILGSAL